jgi:hypothetical protein
MGTFWFTAAVFFLIPALVGTVFHSVTRARLLIDSKLYRQYRQKDYTIHFPLEMRSFWGKDRNAFGIFFVPGYNIIFLIEGIYMYNRDVKETELYKLNNPQLINSRK